MPSSPTVTASYKLLAGGEECRVITNISGKKNGTGTDALGQYVFHCHNIEHEDMRMMGTFNVVA